MLGFEKRGKPEYSEKNPLGAEQRAGPEIEPGTHWWEASALTPMPSLLHLLLSLEANITASGFMHNH